MKVDGVPYRTVWVDPQDGWSVRIIDQTKLPWALEIVRLTDVAQTAHAIRSMQVRGAPLIGAVAAYGLCLALRQDPSSDAMERDAATLMATRPTAVNLRWALERMLTRLRNTPAAERERTAYAEAAAIADEDAAQNEAIGRHGMPLIEAVAKRKSGQRVNLLTHCNAGWLATVDWGTALAPIYRAHDAGIDLHVWVDETRPRNQGAALTAWELGRHGVAHTVVADNAGGHLMQHGEVDLAIVGADRVTRTGDAANKIGTYLKALAALRQRRAVLGRAAVHHDRLDGVRRHRRNPDRAAQCRGGHRRHRPYGGWHDRDGACCSNWEFGRQSGVRRDARAPGHGLITERGRTRRECRRLGGAVSRTCLSGGSMVRQRAFATKHTKNTEVWDLRVLCVFVVNPKNDAGDALRIPAGCSPAVRVRGAPDATGRARAALRAHPVRADLPRCRGGDRAARMAAVRLAGGRRSARQLPARLAAGQA